MLLCDKKYWCIFFSSSNSNFIITFQCQLATQLGLHEAIFILSVVYQYHISISLSVHRLDCKKLSSLCQSCTSLHVSHFTISTTFGFHEAFLIVQSCTPLLHFTVSTPFGLHKVFFILLVICAHHYHISLSVHRLDYTKLSS